MERRLRQGVAFVIVAGGAVGCNPIAGRLYALHNDFLHPIVFAGSMVLAGSAFFALGRFLHAREVGTWRV